MMTSRDLVERSWFLDPDHEMEVENPHGWAFLDR